MTRWEKDKLIADFVGVKLLSKQEYIELVACPPHEVDNMPEYYPTFYQWDRLMPVAEGLINSFDYHKKVDFDDLMNAGGRFNIDEIYDEVVDIIIKINKSL